MIGLSPNAPLPTATIPKKSSRRLPSSARVTKATRSITNGSLSPRHKLSYNNKATLHNLVRISELHQKQSHWTIENDLCGTPEKLATVGGFMNRTIPFATELKASAGSEPTRDTQDDPHNTAITPRLVACLL